MGTWRTLQPRRISHAPGAISLHSSFGQVRLEPGPAGQELRTLPTVQLRPPKHEEIHCYITWHFVMLTQFKDIIQCY